MCGQRPDMGMTKGPTWAECGMDKGPARDLAPPSPIL